jgi:hypothetical protein
MRTIAATILFAALAQAVFLQATPSAADGSAPTAAATSVKFEIADIHASPPRRFPYFDGAFLEDGRYIVRQATVADLIATAYGLKDSSYVYGGPSWLDWDRWEVIAKVPTGTTGALSFYDAVSKELGLKLVKEKRPEQVVVFDHIDEQPTPN